MQLKLDSATSYEVPEHCTGAADMYMDAHCPCLGAQVATIMDTTTIMARRLHCKFSWCCIADGTALANQYE